MMCPRCGEEETGLPGLELGCSLDTPGGGNRRVKDRAKSKRKTGKHVEPSIRLKKFCPQSLKQTEWDTDAGLASAKP